MNKFKKLVAVLVSVVMACVFATGVFATDYVENLSAARAEVNGYLTSAGVYGMDGVVNSLNETQRGQVFPGQGHRLLLVSGTPIASTIS